MALYTVSGLKKDMRGAFSFARAICIYFSGRAVRAISKSLQKRGFSEKAANVIGGSIVTFGSLGVVAGGFLTAGLAGLSAIVLIIKGTATTVSLVSAAVNTLGGIVSLNLGFSFLDGARKAGFGSKYVFKSSEEAYSASALNEKSSFNAEATSAENFNTVASASAGPSAEVSEPANKIKTPGAKLSTPRPPTR